MIDKLQAYVRLQNIKEKKTRIETFANSIYSALHKKDLNDLERAKVLEIVSEKFEQYLLSKKESTMKEAHITEQAHDLVRMLNIKY